MIFFSLKGHKYISKKCFFSCCAFKTSQKISKICVTSLRHLKKIFCKYLQLVKSTHKSGFVWFLKSYWNIWRNRCGTVRKTREKKLFLGAVVNYQSSLSWVSVGWYLRDIYLRSMVYKSFDSFKSQWSSKPNSSVSFTTISDFSDW